MTEALSLAVALTALVAVMGSAIGSFLNVVIYRVPLGLSVVAPPSACPGCSSGISPRDNVPVLSWVALRGKCRNCRTSISVRYPIVEAVTGILFIVVALRFLPALTASSSVTEVVSGVLVLVAFLYFMATSVALSAIDLDVHRLPDRIVLPGYLVGAVLLGAAALTVGDVGALIRLAAGGAIFFVFYLVLAFAYPGGMGLGDVKLAGVIGIFLGFLGWEQLIVGAAAAFILGGIASAVLIIIRKAGRRSGIPFGPWMLGGAWVAIVAGSTIAGAYLSLVGLN
ncbi:leader peptidase (prepilin peptidase)/N-methyltransferase [Salinibacterium sp. CAN_S4]|uniref:prepilin peptidase n=1 Tax=Salinibacterium sp. CAN_S4 TaxID=2787727 RepID=UPI0018EF6F01